MVKGLARRVIVIKSPEPELFDEVIFMIREDAFSKGVSRSDVLRQAQKTANEYVRRFASGKKRLDLRPVIYALIGALITAAIWVVSAFFF